jgi:hypothetical protein
VCSGITYKTIPVVYKCFIIYQFVSKKTKKIERNGELYTLGDTHSNFVTSTSYAFVQWDARKHDILRYILKHFIQLPTESCDGIMVNTLPLMVQLSRFESWLWLGFYSLAFRVSWNNSFHFSPFEYLPRKYLRDRKKLKFQHIKKHIYIFKELCKVGLSYAVMHKLCLQRPRICRCQLNGEIMVEKQAILFLTSK